MSLVSSRSLHVLFCLLFFCLLPLSGCGLIKADSEFNTGKESSKNEDDQGLRGKPLPYAVDIVVSDGNADLLAKMKGVSSLVVLAKKPPDSLLGIEARARTDAETAVKLLHAECYYDGTADFTLTEEPEIRVTLTLTPGPRYTLARAALSYEPAPYVPEDLTKRVRSYGLFGLDSELLPPPAFPKTLPNVTEGKPVTAEAMLKAVEAFPETLKNTGYPFARIRSQTYSLNRELRELYADIVVDPGPPSYFGDVRVSGNSAVNADFVRALLPWKKGEEPWSDDLLEDYANTLRHTGLFRSVEAKPALEQATGGTDKQLVPIDITVKEALFRTVGASMHYDTGTGFGVEGSWEHRNLFHNGETLRVRAPIATEEQGLHFSFDKAAFLSREQSFSAKASLLHENTEAYERTGVSFDAGIERRITRTFFASAGVFGEGGTLKDNTQDAQSYSAYGPQFSLRHDSRDNTLNPRRGATAKWTIKPFAGSYTESFTALASTLGGSFFYAPFRDNDGAKSDKLVLAARLEGGALIGPERSIIPTSMRYFTGGAGSVRGYAYQAIGPRDKDDDPAGGRSYQLVNLEARYKITDEIGIVPFVDGGMVYTDELPEIIGDMRWGAGLGLRYFTPIGPLRFDVATPLNPIEGDPPVQIYISIGQSF